jgi:hypothetical protein
MRIGLPTRLLCTAFVVALPGVSVAQERVEIYAGGLGGISALSADTTSVAADDDFRISFYAPENGPAVNLFIGTHLTDYVSLQANYLWNRNDLGFESGGVTEGLPAHGAVRTRSTQHGVVGDLLVYFRKRSSRLRPYLSVGFGVFTLDSAPVAASPDALLAEAATFATTTPVVRVAVGIDIPLNPRWYIRYSFSEGISGNPIGDRLTPPGGRALMNFQNLVGLLVAF